MYLPVSFPVSFPPPSIPSFLDFFPHWQLMSHLRSYFKRNTCRSVALVSWLLEQKGDGRTHKSSMIKWFTKHILCVRHSPECLPVRPGYGYSLHMGQLLVCLKDPVTPDSGTEYPWPRLRLFTHPVIPWSLHDDIRRDLQISLPIVVIVCVHAKSLQSCLTLCNPMDCGLPGSSVHGILQTRILEWVAMPPSRGIFLTQGSTHT